MKKKKVLHFSLFDTQNLFWNELMECLEPEHLKGRLSHPKNNYESIWSEKIFLPKNKSFISCLLILTKWSNDVFDSLWS